MKRMNKTEILLTLQKGKITLQGQFVNGSNYTFLVQVKQEAVEFNAVYKPARGEQPLWDFPERTLAKREAAAYTISEMLGWELVPPTLYRRGGPLGVGSLQYFIDHDPNDHYFNFSEADKQRLRPVAVFDVLINNADRKGSHILRDSEDHLWLIDHGVCFHVEEKLRTVIWNFSGQPIPADLLAGVERLLAALEGESAERAALTKLLRPSEIKALARRARGLLQTPVFPFPSNKVRPYPWPPV